MKAQKCKLISENCCGKKHAVNLPYHIAWAAARGIAMNTHDEVVLEGPHGTANFKWDGSGTVLWNDKSTCPQAITTFGPDTTVCI